MSCPTTGTLSKNVSNFALPASVFTHLRKTQTAMPSRPAITYQYAVTKPERPMRMRVRMGRVAPMSSNMAEIFGTTTVMRTPTIVRPTPIMIAG